MENAAEITLDQAIDLIRSIDIRLIPECRDFDTYTDADNIWRIGDCGYVDTEVYEQAFRDYEERNGEAEWARTMYVLDGNQPTYLEFFVKAYNYGGLELLEHLLNLQFENDNADVVYYTHGSDC